MTNLKYSITKPQADFLTLDCMYPAFIGGFNSGKSHIMALSSILDASVSSSSLIALFEPTHQHTKLISWPRVCSLLDEFGIRYVANKHDMSISTSNTQFGDFIFKSLSDPELIVGFQCFRAHIDELDVLPEDQATEAWGKIVARARQMVPGVQDVNRRVSVYSTPEGYKTVYKKWELNKDPMYQMITVSTLSNPFIDPRYIGNLRATYPAKYLEAYLEGKFVNFNSSTVYYCYDVQLHDTNEKLMNNESVYIGCDFNVGNCRGTVYVRRGGGKTWHAIDEFNVHDVPHMINYINLHYKTKGHHIVMYPDSTGSATYANAAPSYIASLADAGFEIRAHKKNPLVEDRVQAANAAFSSGRVFINQRKCPETSRCLVQQAYDKANKPDKASGNDHQNDATTYPIAYELPVRKSVFAIDFSFMTKGGFTDASI